MNGVEVNAELEQTSPEMRACNSIVLSSRSLQHERDGLIGTANDGDGLIGSAIARERWPNWDCDDRDGLIGSATGETPFHWHKTSPA